MSFGQNLLFLRKLRKGMTQEELADQLCVSRQTVSKWETDTGYPEIEKLLILCDLFSCTLDQLIREDLKLSDDACSEVRTEILPAFSCLSYTVISTAPENDALSRIEKLAEEYNLTPSSVIGWDFPHLSQEQINVFHMHGYTAALILEAPITENIPGTRLWHQKSMTYFAVTVTQPFHAPFQRIPNAYKILLASIKANKLKPLSDPEQIGCFEKSYQVDGIEYMDIYIALESDSR